MSADNYMLVRKSVPSGRWWVQMGFVSDERPIPLPRLSDESFGHVEEALREAASHESEHGITMGGDFPDPMGDGT